MVLSSKPVYFFEEAMEIMVRTVNIEPITKEQEFLATPALTKEELTNAFEECLKQVDLNMEYFKDRFPYSCTKGLKYPIIDNIEWTDGFWTGMLWLAYEYTNDKKYKELADKDNKVIFGGRLGQYKYFDMDKVILEALNLVKREL